MASFHSRLWNKHGGYIIYTYIYIPHVPHFVPKGVIRETSRNRHDTDMILIFPYAEKSHETYPIMIYIPYFHIFPTFDAKQIPWKSAPFLINHHFKDALHQLIVQGASSQAKSKGPWHASRSVESSSASGMSSERRAQAAWHGTCLKEPEKSALSIPKKMIRLYMIGTN